MATLNEPRLHLIASSEPSPTFTADSCPELSPCVSPVSTTSHGSGTDVDPRDFLDSEPSSRQSLDSNRSSRQSDGSTLFRQPGHVAGSRGRRRGYVRPQATNFAASARSRESVMNLGSIAHLQYYFARTGLLDGKGAQLARKRPEKRATLDLSLFETTTADGDLDGHDAQARITLDTAVEDAYRDDDDFDESFAESDPGMLPPTVSTYHQREQMIPKPPTIEELQTDLEASLLNVSKALDEAKARKAGSFQEDTDATQLPHMPEQNTQSWYELQGMHILDVVTLAIRAAKMYYTAHELPDRLDSIKSERQIRADLLAVMDVLKQMATRNFSGGMRDEEMKTMFCWVESVFDILRREQEIELAEQAERASWEWLRGDWTGREHEREKAFLESMAAEAEPLPPWTPLSEASECPTPFLRSLQNGLRLVKLHNAAVKRSRRRFGAIPVFHRDTQKPYRCADNLRYWVKAAELRFEVMLKVDVLGVVYDQGPEAWQDFEAAILSWCKHVREEITHDLAK